MRYDEAVAELFSEGAEMVVVTDEPDMLRCRSVILNGLRRHTGENDLHEAAKLLGDDALQTYLALSAIEAARGGLDP